MPGRRSFGRQLPVRPRPLFQNRSSSNQNELPGTSYQAGQQPSPTSGEDQSFYAVVSVTHPKMPEIPTMNSLTFETFFLVYLISALLAQYLYIYKTVWWYPNTLPPSNMTVNFHLIDGNLTTFLILLFSRRVLWLIMWQHLRPSSGNAAFTLFWILACIGLFVFWLVEVIKCIVSLLDVDKTYKLMFLCYPLLLWLPLNGFTEDGCLRSVLGFFSKKYAKNKNHLLTQKLIEQSILSNDPKTRQKEIDAEQVREDIKRLCRDFNSRLAEIVFGSMVCSYYAGLVPMFFTKSHHSYDVSWSLQHTALILVNSFAMLASYLLPPQYLQVLHKFALLLGGYQAVSKEDEASLTVDDEIEDWSPYTVFTHGSLVRYKSNTYKTMGQRNTAYPTDTTHSRFFLFYKPLRMLNWLLGLQFAVVVFQIHVLIWSTHWDHIIAPAILQFFSYYILFITLRDRITLGKYYKLQHSYGGG